MCVCSLHSKYPSRCLNIYCCSDIYLRWPMAFASLIFPHALMLVARETVRAWDWETVRRRRCSFRWHPHAWRHDPVSRLKRLVSVGPMTRRRAAPVRLWIRVYGVYIIQKSIRSIPYMTLRSIRQIHACRRLRRSAIAALAFDRSMRSNCIGAQQEWPPPAIHGKG